jgi:hypothetical protein
MCGSGRRTGWLVARHTKVLHLLHTSRSATAGARLPQESASGRLHCRRSLSKGPAPSPPAPQRFSVAARSRRGPPQLRRTGLAAHPSTMAGGGESRRIEEGSEAFGAGRRRSRLRSGPAVTIGVREGRGAMGDRAGLKKAAIPPSSPGLSRR